MMRKLAIGCWPAKGFSLIEILVVLVIMVIASTFAVLAIGDRLRQNKIEHRAAHLANLLQAAEQKALLESSVLGLSVSQRQYGFVEYQGHHWRPYPKPSVFAAHAWASALRLSVNRKAAPAQLQKPQVIIFPNGLLKPFEISLSDLDDKYHYRVIGQANGTIKLEG